MNGRVHHPHVAFTRIAGRDDDTAESVTQKSADNPLSDDEEEEWEGGNSEEAADAEVERRPWPPTPPTLSIGLVSVLFLLLFTALLLFLPIDSLLNLRAKLGLHSGVNWLPFNDSVWEASAVQSQRIDGSAELSGESWPSPPLPSAAGVSLSEAEVDVAFMLSGDESAGSRLSEDNKAAFRRAVTGVALSLAAVRPAIQSDLWLTECAAALPCPFPSSVMRETSPTPPSDDDVIRHLTQQHRAIPSWKDTWTNSTTSSTFFHAPSRHGTSVPPTSPTTPLIPGETAEDQSVALRFQSDLHALQNPVDCSTAPVMLMDWFVRWGGFGSWSHGRAVALMVGMRAGRTVIEAQGEGGYHQAYSNCTRLKGLGGCDNFLAASHCPYPDNWRELLRLDKLQWAVNHSELDNYTSLSDHIEHLKDRRIIAYWELIADVELYELHHVTRKGWEQPQMEGWLTGPLAYLRHLPECWFNRQALAYHFRLTRPAATRLLTEVARSLRLPDSPNAAANALRYADSRCPDSTRTEHWWISVQVMKLHWQIHQLDPHLISHLTGQTRGHERSSERPSLEAAPLLSYAFIRHGDKAVYGEASYFPDELYFELMHKLGDSKGLRYWYIGSDDLLAPDHVRSLNAQSVHPLQLYSSSLVDDIENKTGHPLARGFAWSVEDSTDEVREGVVWRTMVEFAVGHIADVFFSTWSSNHPRMVYELNTALSDARATSPILTLDTTRTVDSVPVELGKQGRVQGC